MLQPPFPEIPAFGHRGQTILAYGINIAPEILEAVLDVMETEKLLASKARVDVLLKGASMLVQLGETSEAAPDFRPPDVRIR